MSIDFHVPDDVAEAQARVRAFVAEQVIPLEVEALGRHVDDELTRELQRRGRESGLWAPQLSKELGGLGFDHLGSSILLEEAGYSLLGPLALNCAAPDEGNLHLLDKVATEQQRERYLEPLARGDVRSAFAMTEPPPGAGSDPSALRTEAVRDGDEWVINGEKWLITGADGAGFFIVMARTGTAGDDVPGRRRQPRCQGRGARAHDRRLDARWSLPRRPSRTVGSPPTPYSARSTKASATPRCDWRPPG